MSSPSSSTRSYMRRRHPTRAQSSGLLASMSLCFFILLSVLLLVPVAVKAQPEEQMHPQYGTVIGIDLGTTYSCVAVFQGGKVEIIPNDQGNRITPSWVSFNGYERLIGDAAKNAFHQNPKNTVFDTKRLIGRTMSEQSVQRDLEHLPFDVLDKNNNPIIRVKYKDENREFTPEEISAMILTKMKETAEAYLGHGVTHAVITVPAYFNDAQRQATKNAGEIAGLNVLRVINEPTAAALAYGFGKKQDEKKVIVYDLGGGTFDVSLLSIDNGVFEVLATAGDTHLGGEDFDNRVMQHFVDIYMSRTGTDVSTNKRAMGKLKKAVEDAKRILSNQLSTDVEIDSFENGNDFSETLTRAKFEELNMPLFEKTIKPIDQVLRDAGITKKDVDEIVLVGGSTRIPKVQQLLKEHFGKEPSRGINPDEAVAYGAAVQGAILAGINEETVNAVALLDVNSLTLGIETTGGIFSPVIKRNTVIPTKKSAIFSTAVDNQPVVTIKVYEGERGRTKFNHLLGEFDLRGLPPAPKGVPQIEVTFELDANSIMKISAKDKGTGRTEQIVINKDTGRLSQEQIEQMIAEGEKFAEEDRLHRKKADAVNNIAGFLSTLRAQLADKNGMGGKLKQADKAELQEIIKAGANWMDSESREASLEEIEEKFAELQNSVGPITSKLYSQSDADAEGNPYAYDEDPEEGHSDSYKPEDDQGGDYDPRDHADL